MIVIKQFKNFFDDLMRHEFYQSNQASFPLITKSVATDQSPFRANEIRALSTTHRHGWALNFVSKLPRRQYSSQKIYPGVIKRGKYRR